MSEVGKTLTFRPVDPVALERAMTQLRNFSEHATKTNVPAFTCESESMGKILRQWTETVTASCRRRDDVPDEWLHLAHLCIWAWASSETYQPMT